MRANVDSRMWKYIEEKYPISLNMATRLRAGQVITSCVVTVTDQADNDVTSDIVESYGVSTSPSVVISWKKNGGIKGQCYYVLVEGKTAEDDVAYVIELEIR